MFLFYADIVFLSTLSMLIVYPFTAVISIQNAYHKHNQNNQKPDVKERKKLVQSFLGKTVEIQIDRPVGFVHTKEHYSLTYPLNYGYVPGVLGGDGEALDVYLLGVDHPVTKYTCRIIGIVYRENDVEDKLIAAPAGLNFSEEEIKQAIDFQEKYYKTKLEVSPAT